MDNTQKKQLVKPLILLLLSVAIYGADRIYSQQSNTEELQNQDKQVEKVQVTAQPVNQGKVPLPMQPVSTPLENIPSPFALLSASSNNGPNIPGNPNMSEPQRLANLPIFPTGPGNNFNLPYSGNSLMPPGRDVILKAILYKPGDNNNMAILDDGTNEVVAVEGKKTPWGYVSEITEHTIMLDNLQLTLDHSERNISQKSKNTEILPPSVPFIKTPHLPN